MICSCFTQPFSRNSLKEDQPRFTDSGLNGNASIANQVAEVLIGKLTASPGHAVMLLIFDRTGQIVC